MLRAPCSCKTEASCEGARHRSNISLLRLQLHAGGSAPTKGRKVLTTALQDHIVAKPDFSARFVALLGLWLICLIVWRHACGPPERLPQHGFKELPKYTLNHWLASQCAPPLATARWPTSLPSPAERKGTLHAMSQNSADTKGLCPALYSPSSSASETTEATSKTTIRSGPRPEEDSNSKRSKLKGSESRAGEPLQNSASKLRAHLPKLLGLMLLKRRLLFKGLKPGQRRDEGRGSTSSVSPGFITCSGSGHELKQSSKELNSRNSRSSNCCQVLAWSSPRLHRPKAKALGCLWRGLLNPSQHKRKEAPPQSRLLPCFGGLVLR